MTNGSDRNRWTDERLDRLASFIFANAEAIRESGEQLTIVGEQLTSIEQLTQSNSRAIQATLEAQETERLRNEEYRREAAEERAELRQAMIGIANLLSSLDSDRPTILRKLNTIENKVDRLLERGDGDESQA